MSSNINSYVRPTDTTSRRDINKILELIHDLVSQIPEETGLQERIMFTPHVKIRTSSTTFGGADLLNTDVLDMENFVWQRKKPSSGFTYAMVHATTGTGLTFPVSATWFGARCDNDGTSYITIDDNSRLDNTDEISICLRGILPASAGGYVITEKVNEYRLRVVDTNVLEWAIYSSGAYKTAVTYTFTPDVKLRIVVTYKSTSSGQKIYINGSLEDSDSETGAINNSTGDLCVMATAGGTNIVKSGFSIAFWGVLHKEVSSDWVTDYENGLYDTSDGNLELTTINFIGSEIVTPDSETGLIKSS